MILLQGDQLLTVPNIALQTGGDATTVDVRAGTGSAHRSVRLGVRGPSRSQVLDGLKAGEEIVLNARSTSNAPAPAATAALTSTQAAP